MHSKSDEKQVNPAADDSLAPARNRTLWALAAIVVIAVSSGSLLVRFSAAEPSAQARQDVVKVAEKPRPVPPRPNPFERTDLSDVERVALWATSSGDAGNRPFVIVDKARARVMAFEASGQLRSSAPALLGLSRGDDSVPGIGERKMSDIRPEERITPAGRFVAKRGVNLEGEDIVWVDYDAAVSMHRVRAKIPSEKRLQRLASKTVKDNRISYGCINLPVAFYEKVLSPMVHAAPVVVYVLPETRPLRDVFVPARVPEKHARL
jgi:hypothetical protein